MITKYKMEKHNLYRMYIDKFGILRMVMDEISNNIVRGIDVSNMSIDDCVLDENLEYMIYGSGDFDSKRNKVVFE